MALCYHAPRNTKDRDNHQQPKRQEEFSRGASRDRAACCHLVARSQPPELLDGGFLPFEATQVVVAGQLQPLQSSPDILYSCMSPQTTLVFSHFSKSFPLNEKTFRTVVTCRARCSRWTPSPFLTHQVLRSALRRCSCFKAIRRQFTLTAEQCWGASKADGRGRTRSGRLSGYYYFLTQSQVSGL